MATDYLRAESTLVEAEAMALGASDFDTLSRLYMPLQEARRQRRQRCGEGTVRLDILAADASTSLDPERIVSEYPHGQLLVAGWGTIEPARRLRQIQAERALFVETFLAAVYPIGTGKIIVIVPDDQVLLPHVDPTTSVDALLRSLPPHAVVVAEAELPRGPHRGTPQTYAKVMSMWERLHAPFLAAADATADLMKRIQAYRRTIAVDYACELAHQKLSDVARKMPAR